jgi:F-type H+-transporting ATPase subunit b
MLHLADAAQSDPLIPTWPELIIGTICFFAVFGILGKMLLPRLMKTLDERHDQIEGGINRADEAQAEADRVLQQYRAQLDDARHEAARMREEAREQGAAIVAEMRERAEAEARRITDAAQAQLEADRQLASRIVGESLTDVARQGRMVDRFLAELEQGDGSGAAPAAATAATASSAAGSDAGTTEAGQ